MLYMVAFGQMTIDSYGRVWKGKKRAERGTPNGYLQLRKMIDGHRYHANAHRVVYMYFKGPILDGWVVHHINGQKDDNRPDNLEMTTYSRNQSLAHQAGLVDQSGQRNHQSKVSDSDVAKIRLEYSQGGARQKDIATRYGVTFQQISRIVRGDSRRKQAGHTADYSHRRQNHNPDRNPVTGRYRNHTHLDGGIWDQFPIGQIRRKS